MAHKHTSAMFDRAEPTGRALEVVLAMPTYHFFKKAILVKKGLQINNKDRSRFREKKTSKRVTVCFKNVHRLWKEKKNSIENYKEKQSL